MQTSWGITAGSQTHVVDYLRQTVFLLRTYFEIELKYRPISVSFIYKQVGASICYRMVTETPNMETALSSETETRLRLDFGLLVFAFLSTDCLIYSCFSWLIKFKKRLCIQKYMSGHMELYRGNHIALFICKIISVLFRDVLYSNLVGRNGHQGLCTWMWFKWLFDVYLTFN